MNARHRTIRSPRARTVFAVGGAAIAGFTVLEMLLVVGIVALLTVGVAQVFRVSGETVKAGKRISTLTGHAAMIEKQMRADFAALSREGFMVMRHSTAGYNAPRFDGALIQLAPNDPNPRTRRVDELVFFVTGDFTTKRDPIYPTRQAKATQARIYYGHGHMRNPDAPTFYTPIQLDDLNNNPTETPKFGAHGANQYASNWILLRHETLLCQPSTVIKDRLPTALAEPNAVYNGTADPNTAAVEDLDSDIQIDLQPSASSIYRPLQLSEPWNGDVRFVNPRVVRDEVSGGFPQRPRFESGVIDIATTDLSEIRAFLLDAQPFVLPPPGRNPANPPRFLDADAGTGAHLDPVSGSFFYPDVNPAAIDSVAKIMQAWMRQALPANSDAGERMRCEAQPPNFLGSINSAGGTVYLKEYQRTDQNMLSASNFLPGCTEFIVEWSFGKAYPPDDSQGRGGQLIWHGLQRAGGVTPTGQPAFAALPYGDPLASGEDLYQMPYFRSDGSVGHWPPLPAEPATGAPPTLNINVVRDYNPFNPGFVPEYSYFAYVDPSYRIRSAWTDVPIGPVSNPPRPGNRIFDAGEAFEDRNGDRRQQTGLPNPADNEPTLGNGDMWFDINGSASEKADPREPGTVPWPWPKLVRITISIADPSEPMREHTFQFVVEVPRSQNEAPVQ